MQFRHGDLLIIKIDNVPASAKPVKDKILAYGEATGHKHQLVGNATIFRDQENKQYIEIVAATKLVHEEHRDIDLPKGLYGVRNQREYDHYGEVIRSVQD